MKKFLQILFCSMSIAMIIIVVFTSLNSNLLQAWEKLKLEPWFITTLIDFYFNIIIISVWVIYKEGTSLISFLWILSFILLGSIATAGYVFLQILRLKPNESLATVLTQRKNT